MRQQWWARRKRAFAHPTGYTAGCGPHFWRSASRRSTDTTLMGKVGSRVFGLKKGFGHALPVSRQPSTFAIARNINGKFNPVEPGGGSPIAHFPKIAPVG